jgi:uncharacterized protein (DUF488 family)
MEQSGTVEQPSLFTVGHSNHPLGVFVELLKRYEIQVLVDTRSYPYSRHVSHFNREELHQALNRAGIKYLYMGKELGGRPDEDEFYDGERHVLYYRLAESSAFLGGIERLERGIRRFRVAVMCSEENPSICHRHLLVGRVMAGRGARVQHIRGDGTIQADSELQAADNNQRSLFDLPEENTWKSLQSVLRRKQPKSSSGSSDAVESNDWSMSPR